MKKLLRWLKRLMRRYQSSIVYVQRPNCLDLVDAYAKHNCVVVEVREIVYE